MKRLLICVGISCASVLTAPLLAQHSLPMQQNHITHRQHLDAIAESYLSLQDNLPRPLLLLGQEQTAFIDEFTKFLQAKAQTEDKEILLPSIDKHRLALLRAINFYHSGNTDASIAILEGINPSRLYQYEQYQYALLRAYLYLSTRSDKAGLEQARLLLQQCLNSNDLIGEQAYLYKAYLHGNSGQHQAAQKLLEQRQWSETMLPEVDYLGCLLSYHLDKPSIALANSQKLLSRYPNMQTRLRLLGRMASAYYLIGDYPQTITTLKAIDREQLLPDESYILGSAYYELGKYPQAIEPLQYASQSQGKTSGLAQFALGNIYQLQKDYPKAQLAFDAVNQNPQVPQSLQEEATYRQVEIGHNAGYDMFGKQLKLIQTFLRQYPNSNHRNRILEIIRGNISHSYNYDRSLELIEELKPYGLHLNDLKQDTYLKQALALPAHSKAYLSTLGQAIALGPAGESYLQALNARAKSHLHNREYLLAQKDAEQAIRATNELKASNPESLYLLGYSLFNQRQYKDVVTSLLRFVAQTNEVALKRDALLRLGDASLAMKQGNVALDYYQQAQRVGNEGSDEALYRIAHIYTQQGKTEQAIEHINLAVSSFPSSSYLPQMLYDKGRSELRLGRKEAALATFYKIYHNYPATPIASTALLERALIYSNSHQDDEAIIAYKEVVQRYPDSPEAQTALSDLKSLYNEQGKLETYITYVKTLQGKLKPSEQDEADLQFYALQSKYERGQLKSSDVETFLSNYSHSAHKLQAQQLLANSYIQEQKLSQADEVLKSLLDNPKFTSVDGIVTARLRRADINKLQGNYEEAFRLYHSAYTSANGNKNYRIDAGLGTLLMAQHLPSTNATREVALEVAETLLRRSDLGTSTREQITLEKGKIQEMYKSFNAATATYAQLNSAIHSRYGAEAIVRQADILFRLGKIDESKKVLDKFIASGSNQDYWVARAFILLSDCYGKKGEHYLAKQYLESLQENYTGKEHDIQEMIQARLSKYNK